MDEDKKPIVYTEDPFSYNYVALKQSKVNELPVPTAQQLVATPTYNRIGKFLGLKDVHDWNREYDKVFRITEWAKERTDSDDPEVLLNYITGVSDEVKGIGKNKLHDLNMHIVMGGEK